ncbi:hypothetical protein BS50DRAFT_637545 [Corynespora cassiicola Philippines]|uniref:Jacalin-type lectin domain-containing protein n=1 Tax=Corynespora cassiicola Philippines TaxID=1448308 RepID=A0A2T2NCL8_CORCC|nr:hypothetical protein BS50DRAFT_637545 [Corynespora cassiicola Philippines]
MLLPTPKTLLLALTSLHLTTATLGDPRHCTSHNMRTAPPSGPTGKQPPSGTPFCTSKVLDGILINGIECFADENSLRGIRFFYTDQSTLLVGKDIEQHGATGKVMWNPATERITELSLWGGGWDGFMGRIVVEVEGDEKRRIDCGHYRKHWGAADKQVDLGAGGLLIGASGGCGDAVDNIEFQFSASKPQGIQMKEVKFPEILNPEGNPNANGIDQVTVDEVRFINTLDTENLTIKDLKFSEGKERSGSWAVSETSTFGFGQTIGIGVELPGVPVSIESSTSWNWENTNSRENTSEWKDWRDMSWSTGEVNIKPGQAMVCKLYALKGQLQDTKYEAKMEVYFHDNTVFNYNMIGRMKMVDWSKSTLHCDNEDAEKALSELNAGHGRQLSPDGKELAGSKPQEKRSLRFSA